MTYPLSMFPHRAPSVFRIVGIAYGVLIVLLTIPFVQNHVLFAHKARWPLFARFDAPEKYGLAPGKTLNLNLTTSDGVILGAWFILSDQHHQSLPLCLGSTPTDRFSNDQIKSALTSHSTIIFFHGNAGTRAVKARVRHYEAFSSRLHSNVLAIDYRGFADSEGSPTEAGLVLDAKAAWDWVIAHGSRPEDVLLMGSSLGTAVAAKLAAELSAQGVIFKGLTMLSPFSSVTALLDTYHILGFLPVVKPLTMIPGADRLFFAWAIVHDFNTKALSSSIDAPILIVHAHNDWDIPIKHSESLFDILLDPLLTPLPQILDAATNQVTEIGRIVHERSQQREKLVSKFTMRNFGVLEEFTSKRGRRVALLKTEAGGHNKVGLLEGVQDIIRHVFF